MGDVMSPEKLYLDWEDTEKLSVQLADQVGESGQEFDRLLVLQRGGVFPGNIVSRRLGFLAHRILSASLTSYKPGTSERHIEFKTGQFPTARDVMGKHVLVIDEVCDTGHTLVEVARRLRERGAKFATGVLHYKPEFSQTGVVPDYYVVETNKWIVYPWEVHERDEIDDPAVAA